MDTQSIQILVVVDHAMLRKGMEALLNEADNFVLVQALRKCR